MTNAGSKSAVLGAIRESLRAAESVATAHAHAGSDFGVNRPFVAVDNAEIFCANLRAIGGNCLIAADLNAAADEVRKILKERSPETTAISDSPLAISVASMIDRNFVKKALADELFECGVGITSAQYGISETGTLVIESGAEFNRLASLIPPVHICLIGKSKLRSNLGEVLAVIDTQASRSVTFITGQSRTSDIELTLALGVHGPKELNVIIIENE